MHLSEVNYTGFNLLSMNSAKSESGQIIKWQLKQNNGKIQYIQYMFSNTNKKNLEFQLANAPEMLLLNVMDEPNSKSLSYSHVPIHLLLRL